MNDESIIHLLIVEETPNDADRYVSMLRNAGHAVRSTHVEDDEDMEIALKEQTFDLVLSAPKLEFIDYRLALQLIAKSGRTVPLILITDNPDDKLRTEALANGVRDVVNKAIPEHLPLIIRRELDAVKNRKSLNIYRQRYMELEKRNRSLLDSSRDAITYVHDGMHVYANTSYLNMFEYSDFEDIESTPIMDMVLPEDHKKFKTFIRNYVKKPQDDQKLEVNCIKLNGNEFNATMEFNPASIEGESCTQIIIRDQSINKELEKKLKTLSNQDLLTGLYNRQYFIEELEMATAKALKSDDSLTQALIYIDIDDFRAIMDKVGIAASDLVLVDIANLIVSNIRVGDIIARFGDQIFTLITSYESEDDIKRYAESIRTAIEEHISEAADQSVNPTCSLGITTIGDGAKSAQEVLSRADIACEKAHKDGGNKVHLHNPIADSDANIERDQQWILRIKHAIKKNQFRLYFQPIVSLMGEPAENYQVLLRMIDEEGKEILPGQFLPVAEKHQLMPYIDRWVINHLLPVLAEQSRNNKKTGFFVKIAAQSFTDSTLLPWFADQLRNAKLPGERITFEINEEDALNHIKAAKSFITGAKALRCKMALAHFGGTPNPMNSLKHLSVQYLKFDRTLMHQMNSSPEQQAIIKNLTSQAHDLGKLTIAEFVEDANSLAALWQSGVDYIQGYFLQEPTENLSFDFTQDSM